MNGYQKKYQYYILINVKISKMIKKRMLCTFACRMPGAFSVQAMNEYIMME